MVTKLDINSSILMSYIEQSHASVEQIQEKVKSIELIISGEKQPTFNQLAQISKIINIPTGLLLLNKKIDSSNQRLDYRTLDSKKIDQENISPELRDTIDEMEIKQEFLKNELDYELDFVGKYNVGENYLALSNAIREKLDISEDHFLNKVFKKNPLNFYRDKINNIGVFVFFNGKVKDNVYRPLNTNEFRGFVLSDRTAPIIFINQTDSKTGQLFTLVHELVHLFIGQEGIFNINENDDSSNEIEAYVNKVTAEILVPKKYLGQENTLDINILANKYRVSKFVIARRLFDTNKINRDSYISISNDLQKEFEINKKYTSKKKSGGDYNNNLKFRMDTHFFYCVESALNQNKISYTEAFSVLGIGYKGFKTLQEGYK